MCDLSHLPYLHDQLDQVARREGFTPGRYLVEISTGSALSDGFMSAIVSLRISEGDRELVLLCKVPMGSESRRSHGIGLFEREIRAYYELLPAMFELQREKGLSVENEGFFCVPKCYGAICVPEKLEALLVMEDLRQRGFRTWNKYEPVDLNHTELVFLELGKLHANSFALREQKPDEFRKFQGYKDPMMVALEEGDVFVNMLKSMCDRAMSTLEEHEEILREKVRDLQCDLKDELKRCVTAELAEPYAVVCHGDCWINNFMFTYGNDDKTPTTVTFIDWQICRYGSPVIDLVYYLFLCTDHQFRKQHYTSLLDLYYNSLSTHLSRLGGDATEQFPRAELKKQLKSFGKFGFVMAMLILPGICTPNKELLTDVDKATAAVGKPNVTENCEVADARYRQRISGVIRDMVQLGYL